MPASSYIPPIDSLRCFLAGAKHLNFRRAADEVALTPTAFSQRIKQMERALGEELFHRTTRSVRLTRAGLSLVPVARNAIDGVRRCVEAVLQGADTPVRITLGTRFELGLSWLLPSIIRFEEVHPAWEIDSYFGVGSDILHQLRAGIIDCVVTSAQVARAEWSVQVLHPETYMLVGSPNHIQNHPLDRPSQASNHCLFDANPDLPLARYILDADNPELDFEQIRVCGTTAAIRQMVQAGRGVAVLPTYLVANDIQQGTLVQLLPELNMLQDTFRLLYRKDHPASAVFESFADFLRSQPLIA